MTDEDLIAAAERAAKNCKRALVLTVLAVAFAGVVLAIDFGIKRAVLDAVADARATLDEFKVVAAEAGEAGAGAGGSVADGDDLP